MVYFDKTFNTDAEADSFIEAYEREYHPAGYGTRCRKEKLADGKIKVLISRGDSCD